MGRFPGNVTKTMANEGAHAGNKLRHATPAATDAVVVRLEVEEKTEMTVGLEEFQYNPSPPVSLGEGEWCA